MDGQTGSLDLAAVLAQIGQGLVVQQETTTRILETMNRTTRSTITGIPIPEFGGKATESPKLWLRDIRRYLQATFPDGSPDLGATLGTALKGAAREWFLRTEFADGSWEEFEDLFRGRFKNEDAEWRTFKQLRKLRLRKDVEGFLEEAEMVIYEAPSDAELGRMFKLQCVIDALPNELQQWVLHGDPRDAKEAIEKLRSKRKVELGGTIDGRNADVGRRQEVFRENRSSWETREREDSDISQDEGTRVTPMEIGAITCYDCKKKGHRQRNCPRRSTARAQGAVAHMSGITAADDVAYVRGVFAVEADARAASGSAAGLTSGNKPARTQVDAKTTMKNRHRSTSSGRRKLDTGQIKNNKQRTDKGCKGAMGWQGRQRHELATLRGTIDKLVKRQDLYEEALERCLSKRKSDIGLVHHDKSRGLDDRRVERERTCLQRQELKEELTSNEKKSSKMGNGFLSSGGQRPRPVHEVDLQVILNNLDKLEQWVQEQKLYAMKGHRPSSILLSSRGRQGHCGQ